MALPLSLSPRRNSIDAFFSSFRLLQRGEEVAFITLARCLLRERTSVFIASAGESAEKGASSCAKGDGERNIFFQLFSSERTHGLDPLARDAGVAVVTAF